MTAASRDMVSSAPYSTTTCTGSLLTGAVMGYDDERRLTSWQSAPSNPGATAGYASDGEGHRVAQRIRPGASGRLLAPRRASS